MKYVNTTVYRLVDSETKQIFESGVPTPPESEDTAFFKNQRRAGTLKTEAEVEQPEKFGTFKVEADKDATDAEDAAMAAIAKAEKEKADKQAALAPKSKP